MVYFGRLEKFKSIFLKPLDLFVWFWLMTPWFDCPSLFLTKMHLKFLNCLKKLFFWCHINSFTTSPNLIKVSNAYFFFSHHSQLQLYLRHGCWLHKCMVWCRRVRESSEPFLDAREFGISKGRLSFILIYIAFTN